MMITRSFIFFILIIHSFSISIVYGQITGKGPAKSITRELPYFNDIEIHGDINVSLNQEQGKHRVDIVSHANLISLIETKVEDSILIISLKEDIKNFKYLNITITFDNIQFLSLKGSLHFSCIQKLNLEELYVSISGNSFVELELTIGKELEINAIGNSTIQMEGSAETATLEIKGPGKYKGYDFIVQDQKVDINGNASVELNAEKKLDVEIHGTSKVKYKGTPILTKKIYGLGKIESK